MASRSGTLRVGTHIGPYEIVEFHGAPQLVRCNAGIHRPDAGSRQHLRVIEHFAGHAMAIGARPCSEQRVTWTLNFGSAFV